MVGNGQSYQSASHVRITASLDKLTSVSMVAETQLPPTLVAIAFVITFFAVPENKFNLAVFMSAPKVAVMCFISVLNRRRRLRSHWSGSLSYKVSNDPASTRVRTDQAALWRTSTISVSRWYQYSDRDTHRRECNAASAQR